MNENAESETCEMCDSCEICDCGDCCGEGCDCCDMAESLIDPTQPLIGQQIPYIELEAYHQGEFTTVNLGDYRGKWAVLVFYPADFTFVCPTELEDLAAHYSEFQNLNTEILSVSTDTKYTHLAWHESSRAVGKVGYPMLADPAGIISRLLGVYLEETGLDLRGTFVIDPDGVIVTMEIHADGIGRSATELLRKVQAAQFVYEHGDQVCPANWKPGEKTLKPGEALVGKL